MLARRFWELIFKFIYDLLVPYCIFVGYSSSARKNNSFSFLLMFAELFTFAAAKAERDVAQSGLEYSSGGRVVAGSNPVIPTI